MNWFNSHQLTCPGGVECLHRIMFRVKNRCLCIYYTDRKKFMKFSVPQVQGYLCTQSYETFINLS